MSQRDKKGQFISNNGFVKERETNEQLNKELADYVDSNPEIRKEIIKTIARKAQEGDSRAIGMIMGDYKASAKPEELVYTAEEYAQAEAEVDAMIEAMENEPDYKTYHPKMTQ